MARAWQEARTYRGLALALLIVGLGSAAVISCGGGGGSSNGGLCEQCGDDPDGPCQSLVFVPVGPDAPGICQDDTPDPAATPCPVLLECFRMLGSAQRRCYPKFDEQFRCNGERANRSTPVPTTTPTATASPTVRTVTFSVNGPAGLQVFSLSVDYPTETGNFTGSGTAVGCSTPAATNLTFAKNDDDAGTLTLAVTNSLGLSLPTVITCTFDQETDADPLTASDLTVSGTPETITVDTSVS